MLYNILFHLLFIAGVHSARILGVFPIPSISHQIVFRALTFELANRGHELVIITPNPALPKDRPKDNITEIDIGNSYKIMKNMQEKSDFLYKRGVIMTFDSLLSDDGVGNILHFTSHIFDNFEVKELIEGKDTKFDLIIAETMMHAHLIFAKIYNAPVILLSSFYGLPEAFETMGAVSRHPILNPHVFRNNYRDLSLFDKIREIYNEVRFVQIFRGIDEKENEFLKNKFGDEAPTIKELKEYVSLLLLNAFPIFDNNRPVPPGVVYLGALHLQPVKELPEDLKKYLDNSKSGVVYVSLGTNVRPDLMDQDLLDAFLKAFEVIPYDILWKFEGNNLENLPNNVKIQKWFPQRDLLMHPNIKVFVTQGGLQSTDEAIDAGVPLVGIPMLADQWYNVNKYVDLGIGVGLDGITLTADILVKGVNTVINDDSYRRNMKKVKTLMYDQPQRPLERAVWWTEHVLRHGGAPHLRAPAANMSYWEFLMADVVLVILSAFLAVLFVVIFILYYLISLFKSSKTVKIKRS